MPIKPGQVLNPKGGAAHDQDVRRVRRLTHEEVKQIGTVLLTATGEQVVQIANDREEPVLRRWMAGIIADGVQKKNYKILDEMLNRIIGKPIETVINYNTNKEAVETPEEAELRRKVVEDRLKSMAKAGDE